MRTGTECLAGTLAGAVGPGGKKRRMTDSRLTYRNERWMLVGGAIGVAAGALIAWLVLGAAALDADAALGS